MKMEKFDVIDKYGNKTGKQGIHGKINKGEYMAISHICVFSKDGLMLIQKRGPQKVDFPNQFDITAGGGVMAGETTYQAAIRELKEELDLSLEVDDYPLIRIYYPLGIDDYYYTIVDIKDIDVKIDHNEVIDYKWASKNEILDMMKNNQFVQYNEGFIEYLFSSYKNRGTYIK